MKRPRLEDYGGSLMPDGSIHWEDPDGAEEYEAAMHEWEREAER